MRDNLNPDQREARDKINDFLAGLAPTLAPKDEDFADDGPKPEAPVFLSDWVFVCQWIDAGGEAFMTKIDGPNLTRSKRSGLLFEALHWEGRV